jgi:hypothetical protein
MRPAAIQRGRTPLRPSGDRPRPRAPSALRRRERRSPQRLCRAGREHDAATSTRPKSRRTLLAPARGPAPLPTPGRPTRRAGRLPGNSLAAGESRAGGRKPSNSTHPGLQSAAEFGSEPAVAVPLEESPPSMARPPGRRPRPAPTVAPGARPCPACSPAAPAPAPAVRCGTPRGVPASRNPGPSTCVEEGAVFRNADTA